MKKNPFTTLLFSLSFVIFSINVTAQDVGDKTLKSQSRTTTANIGNSDITITYHSPSVNGRKIFGGIVPFDFIVDGVEYPWRAGSNQRTTIEFSHDVKIQGNHLPAGSYGFLVLVSQKEWTLIFSSGKSWGAFNYDSSNDVLRIPVKTNTVPFQEWLSYEFHNPTSQSVDIVLKWEETLVSFSVSTDATSNKLKDISKKEEKTIADYQDLAIWTLDQNPSKIDESLAFLYKALDMIPNLEQERMRKAQEFFTKTLIADLLIQKGENEKSIKMKEEALEISGGFDIYYYALRKYTVEGKKKEAYQILKDNVKRNPENFQTHIAFGEYYLKEKDQKKAVEHFKKAYEIALKQNSWVNYTKYLYLQNKLVLENS